MAKIGVIVPVYNVEKYLCKCIDSILLQTFQDFELILIDDGSTDQSGEICDKYAERYGNIRVFHGEHKGVADARNKGVDENTGEYIAFVDSDDWIDKQYLEVLYRLIEKYRADLVISGGINVTETYRVNYIDNVDYMQMVLDAEIVSKHEAYRRMLLCENNLTVAPWAKLYHQKLVQLFRYPSGEIYEDLKVINKIIEGSERIVCTSYTGYFYLRRKGSITHGRMSAEHMTGLKNAKCVWDFIKQYYPNIEDAAKVHYLRKCFDIFNMMLLNSDYYQECQKLRREIINEKKYLLFCNHFNFVEKIGSICLMVGIPWYRLALREYLWWTRKE